MAVVVTNVMSKSAKKLGEEVDNEVVEAWIRGELGGCSSDVKSSIALRAPYLTDSRLDDFLDEHGEHKMTTDSADQNELNELGFS